MDDSEADQSPSTEMTKMEISLRIENDRIAMEKEAMVEVIKQLTMEVSAAHASLAAADLHDVESRESPPARLAAFPSRALRYQTQRIGLFTF